MKRNRWFTFAFIGSTLVTWLYLFAQLLLS